MYVNQEEKECGRVNKKIKDETNKIEGNLSQDRQTTMCED